MLKKRIIAVLLIKDGMLVRSHQFQLHQIVGEPNQQILRYNDWQLDELILLDISRETNIERNLTTLKKINYHLNMPLTFGGNISSMEHIEAYLHHGAEKVVINSAAHFNPSFITEAAKTFGSQAIIVGIDIKQQKNQYNVVYQHGQMTSKYNPKDWLKQVHELGAGEIFLHFVDFDGTNKGYPTDAIDQVITPLTTPIIICGGAKSFQDILHLLKHPGVHAAAASNVFLFTELSYAQCKLSLSPEDNVREYMDDV